MASFDDLSEAHKKTAAILFILKKELASRGKPMAFDKATFVL